MYYKKVGKFLVKLYLFQKRIESYYIEFRFCAIVLGTNRLQDRQRDIYYVVTIRLRHKYYYCQKHK